MSTQREQDAEEVYQQYRNGFEKLAERDDAAGDAARAFKRHAGVDDDD